MIDRAELSKILYDAQILARSDNPIDHVIAREMIAKLIEHNENS
jgi:hypothetical protein